MVTIRLFVILIFCAQLGLPSSAFAQVNQIVRLGELGAVSKAKLAAKGIDSVEVEKAGSLSRLHFLDASGNTLRTLEVNATTRAELAEFRPSKIHEYLHIMKTQSPHIAKTKLKQFPTEAVAFFFAIGAVTTWELIANYSKNPVGMEQFLEMQKDPVGAVGFAAFMVANGLAAEPIMMMTQSKALRIFIPYLGMSVGMMASNVVHEIGHFPHLMECALKRKNCDKAYEAWLDYRFDDKAHQWNPGLVSLLISAAGSGLIEMGVRATLPKVLRIVGAEFLLSLTPTGWVGKGGMWVLKVARFASFVYLDHLIIEPVNFAYQNAIGAGPVLKEQGQRLITAANRERLGFNSATQNLCPTDRLKRSGEKCAEDFSNRIYEFSHRMNDWQEVNLSQVNMSYQNWQQYLGGLSAQYQVAKSFYHDLVTDLWNARFYTAEGYSPLVLRSAPLHGVYIAEGELAELEAQVFQPAIVEDLQRDWLGQTARSFFNSALARDLQAKLHPSDRKAFDEIEAALLSNNLKQMGQALRRLRNILRKDAYLKFESRSPELTRALKVLSDKIGPDAEPLLVPGELYLRLVTQQNELYQANIFNSGMGQAKLGSTYSLLRQMIMGPDPKLDSLVKSNLSGFPAEFIPPKITPLSNLSSARLPTDNYTPVAEDLKFNNYGLIQNRTRLGSPMTFLAQGGLDPAILGDQEGGARVHIWWDEQVDPHVAKALSDYTHKYRAIVQVLRKELLSGLYLTEPAKTSARGNRSSSGNSNKGKFFMNRSDFSNGGFALHREAMTMLLALSQNPQSYSEPKENDLALNWARQSLVTAPAKLRKLEADLDTVYEQAIQYFSSGTMDPKKVLQTIGEWHINYGDYLDSLDINERQAQVLTASVDQQIERLRNWVLMMLATDFKQFTDGNAEQPKVTCPNGNSMNVFLKNLGCP